MNYIIFKGVQSTEIDGLLISELPPITKPEMRIEETIIDGKDGSQYEELGYAPYEKPVSIGLRGNFSIDKVMKYLSGEGEVVFSNEPDKVYIAKIFNRIDYTRLLRFRQATIPFIVQPYKYKRFEAVKSIETTPAEIFNEGLEPSKPIMILKGNGTVSISINGGYVFEYTFPTNETEVVIDSEKEDAYLNDELKNRNMNGEFPILQPGTNKIEWTGNIESIDVQPRSRWL